MTTTTSAMSYEQFVDEGKIDSIKDILYQFIKDNPHCSTEEMVVGTGIRHQTLCGVKKPMDNDRTIIKSGEKLNETTGRYVETWIINEGSVVKEQIQPILVELLNNSEMDKIESMIAKANEFQKNKIKGWCNNE